MPPRARVKKEAGDEDTSGPVKCAACQEEMDAKDFEKHNLNKHNMLAWIEGKDPLDLTNNKLVVSILTKLLKSKKKKVLQCDTCDAEKKSALGFFAHKQVCQKSEEEKQQMRVRCEICGRTMMPVSYRPHMLVHEKSAAAAAVAAEMAVTNAGMDAVEIVGRRAAATKAKSRMMEFLSDDGARSMAVSPIKSSRKTLLYVTTGSLPKHVPNTLVRTWNKTLMDFGTIRCPHLGCEFEVDEVNKLLTHLPACCFIPQSIVFLCAICLLQSSDEMEMIQHVRTQHDDLESDMSTSEWQSSSEEEFTSGQEDTDGSRPRPSYRPRPKVYTQPRSSCRSTFLANEEFSNYSKELEPFPPALRWTLNFRLWNYSELLFTKMCSQAEHWTLLEGAVADDYLPTGHSSVCTEFPVEGVTRRFSMFESDVIDGGGVFFAGGPVWATAWCPHPLNLSLSNDCELSQYLALSCHRGMDDYHLAHTCFSSSNSIQLWDCGLMEHNSTIQTPKLALALAHDFGTVWDLQWCPSGAFDQDEDSTNFQRLGLLAAACSDGTARIFAVCKPQQLTAHLSKGALPVYKTEPALTLVVDFQESSQCTRVSWYQGKRHWLLAASFCNGMVGLWDLENTSSLLWDAESRCLRPYHCFQAHLSVITALSLSPDQNGRYLMTGSHDRSVKFWDLEDTSAPMTMHRRNTVTDGIWLGHWVSTVTSYDDAFLHEHTNATLTPVREFGYKPYPVLAQNSVGWSLSYNEWLNAVLQGSEAGEVTVNFASQLLAGLDNEKGSVERRMMLSFTELKELYVDGGGVEQLGKVTMWKTDSNKGKGKGKAKAKGKGGGKGKKGMKAEEILEVPETEAQVNEVEHESKPQTYEETEKKFGLSMCDLLKHPAARSKIASEAAAQVRLSSRMNAAWSDMYPITSINRVCWNPNGRSFLWLATGHHCGLVRLLFLDFMQTSTIKSFISNAARALR